MPDEKFYVPKKCVAHFQSRFEELRQNISVWKTSLSEAQQEDAFNNAWKMTIDDELPFLTYPQFEAGASLATRKAFGATLDEFAKQLPHLVGGSADLEPSNYTGNFAKTYGDFLKDNTKGRNFAFGVREFPMASMMNGNGSIGLISD